MLCWCVWIAALAWTFVWWRYKHFKRQGVFYLEPTFLFGSMLPVARKKVTSADFFRSLYEKMEGRSYAGFFSFLRPILVVRDPQVIRDVCVKDFDHFTDRLTNVTERAEPILARNLVALKGNTWKEMRATLSPAFTSSKIKIMFGLMMNVGEQLVDHLRTEMSDKGPELKLEMKDLFTHFTNDVIATTAFGLKVDSLKNPENRFYTLGHELTSPTGARRWKALGFMMFPWLMQLLKVSYITPETREFFWNTIVETMKVREKEGIVRPDMIHLLMQARRGELSSEGGEGNETRRHKKPELSEVDIVAQAFVFFLGGFDTVSTVLTFVSYMIATQPGVQDRIKSEIEEVQKQNGGKITYEGIQEMKYLDMVISETLRMYTPGLVVSRKCVKRYTLRRTENDGGMVINPGDVIWIPVHGLHHDPQYFPDPDKFDPERFSDENKNRIQPFTYNPFGVGPRICIAQRFAILEVKIAVASILSHFSLDVVPETTVPLRLSKKNFAPAIDGGCWLAIKEDKHA